MLSSSKVRACGLAAMIGSVVGILFFPLNALAYFATPDGAASAKPWARVVRPLVEPLLTFAPPQVVYHTYGKLYLVLFLGFLAGTLGLHACQRAAGSSRAGRRERWGYWLTLVALVLLILGAIGDHWVGPYWPALIDAAYLGLAIPGVLLLMVGTPLFGIGTLRAKVAPRLGAWLLILGGFPGLIVLSMVTGNWAGGLVPFDLAWLIIGYFLWTNPAVERVQPELAIA